MLAFLTILCQNRPRLVLALGRARLIRLMEFSRRSLPPTRTTHNPQHYSNRHFPSSVGAHSAGSHPQGTQQPPPPMDSAQVTEMVGRMLQCVSVLASVQSGDNSQNKMERLTKELKLNWLGRGRTGRQRRGFVGTRLRPTPAFA